METTRTLSPGADEEAEARAELRRILAEMERLDSRIQANRAEIERLTADTTPVRAETEAVLAELRAR